MKNDGTAPTVFLSTRTYYDKEYSIIQVNKQNHLSGADITSNAYDFANRVTKTRRDHTATPPGGSAKTYYIREEYTYDDAGRLRFTRHHVKTTAGVPASGWVVTAAPVYDELNRLADKRLHASNYDGTSQITVNSSFNYLQSVDYTYNIRGWLTGINDPANACAVQSGDQLADLFNMSLEYESTANGGTAQYNGNISTAQWNTNINGVCSARNIFRFSYDYANRLTAAAYRQRVGTTWVDVSKYTEGSITYDLNGNLKTYLRRGATAGSMIDNLTYTYGDTNRPDRLTNVTDAGDAAKGFIYTAGAAAYQYDLNGNMTQDNHKGFALTYNYLNLPQSFTKGANAITMTYTADGEKLTKGLSDGSPTKNYVSGIEYSGANLEAIYFSEGRCTPNGASAFYYQYNIKDHLGNVRERFQANGTAVTHLENMDYYPFGMLMEGTGSSSPVSDYTYNGKELNEDFGLNLYDYGARWYDPSVGRWWSVDPLTEKQGNWSGYCYALNSPIFFIDPNGMESEAYNFGNNLGKYTQQYEQVKKETAERGSNRDSKRALPIVYVANVAGKSTGFLTGMMNEMSTIFAKNGIKKMTYQFVPTKEAKKFEKGFYNQAFIAVIDKNQYEYDKQSHLKQTMLPGYTLMHRDANVGVYSEMNQPYDIAWQSWINLSAIKGHPNQTYAAGYLAAHEVLHQMLAMAKFDIKGQLDGGGHAGGDWGENLNMDGRQVVIPKGPKNALQPAEHIIPPQMNLLRAAFNF